MTLYTQPQAEVFASGAPPSEIQPFDAWAYGLGIAFIETNGYPEMTGLNGLFNAFNLYIKYLEQNGFAEWRSDMEYPAGAGVRVGLVWYRAKLQNTNKPPATSQTEWELFLNASALAYQEPMYLDGNTIKIRDASTTVKGAIQFANATEVANRSNVSKAINPSNAATIANSMDIGVGQTIRNLTASRLLGVIYTNNTDRSRMVSISVNVGSYQTSTLKVNQGVGFVDVASVYGDTGSGGNITGQLFYIVPPYASYRVDNGSLWLWTEAY